MFGVTISPYILNEIIYKHAHEYHSDIDFVNTMFNSLYVDDSVGGENSLEGAFLLFKKSETTVFKRFISFEKKGK